MIRQVAGRPIVTAARMREIERRGLARGHVTAEKLMEEAAVAVARQANRLAATLPVIVLAGPGNNGGDAYAAAHHLRSFGRDVHVVAFGVPRHGIAAAMAARWTGPTIAAGGPASSLPREYLLVDGLFGIGAVRDDEPAGWTGGDLADRARTIVAIDIPSWLDADTGIVHAWGRHARADVTIALGALKPAHFLAAERCGHLLFHDFDRGIIDADGTTDRIDDDSRWAAMSRPRIAPPSIADHKYRAPVTIVGGAMPGAARLAARGAAGAGAGYVTLLGDPAAAGPLDAIVHRPLAALAEALADDKGVALIGPGLGCDDRARQILDQAFAARCALVLDGDALSLLGRDAAPRLRARDGHVVLTPHEGEFARMFDTGANKFAATQAACRASAATIVHKGHCTIVGDARGRLSATTGGSTWLATAGSGDVLAGAVAARWACGDGAGSPFDQAVQLHARASHLAGAAFSADRLADCLAAAVEECQWPRR